MNLISILFFLHTFFPSARHHTQKFFRISYYNPATGMFALGWDDIFFVFYWLVVFSGLRCAVMDYVLGPLASILGIKKRKPKVRFTEQAWLLLYYSISWCVGMYTMYNSDYWMDLRALWRNWPIREMEGLAKWYYLVQFGFYLQQIVVVNIEERRKDYLQMLVHHIITCCLIFTSYGYHHYRVGTLILSLMDFVDVILPTAKILKYLHYTVACDIAFAVFMVTWFITRHVLYMAVLYSIWAHIPQEIKYGCYTGSVLDLQGPFEVPNDWDHLTQPFRDPVGVVCWNNRIKWAFLLSLFSLQVVLLVWFTAILRVAYKVVTGQGADDVRSDDEDDDDEEEEEEEEDLSIKKASLTGPENKGSNYIDSVHLCSESHHHIETQVLSTDANFSLSNSSKSLTKSKSKYKPAPFVSTSERSPGSDITRSTSSSSTGSRRKHKHETAHSSSVNLLGASSDRKELLGRIGCDKGSASE